MKYRSNARRAGRPGLVSCFLLVTLPPGLLATASDVVIISVRGVLRRLRKAGLRFGD